MSDKLTLREIADWQLDGENSEVELPVVQRGFVWHPEQVENLWDSILREYPIGSFLFSITGDKYLLMDGQQRATSIFMGFFNPYLTQQIKAWDQKKLSKKNSLPVVWIDLQPEDKPNTSKYLIRVTTRSHPWGYKAMSNKEKLSVPDRRNALDIFRQCSKNAGGYTSFENTEFFPYDACSPLPLCFFAESESVEQVIEKAENYLPGYIKTKYGRFKDKTEFLELLKNGDLKKSVQKILEAVKKAKNGRMINYDIASENVLKEEEEQEGENPTLFQRINSAGTSLSGDDLIYSIYKATFPKAKELVEGISSNFVAPTQVISLASRIAWAAINNDDFPLKMSVLQFQKSIKEGVFKKQLQTLIEENVIGCLFERAISILGCEILRCEDVKHFYGVGVLPPVIIKQFVNKSQELFLFFVYWLHVHKDYKIDYETKLKIVAKLLVFSWFGWKNQNISWLWKEGIKREDFWLKPLNEYICRYRNEKGNWNSGIHFLLPPALLTDYFLQENLEQKFINEENDRWLLLVDGVGEKIADYYKKVKLQDQRFDFSTNINFFQGFIDVLKRNRELILFAQRCYINSEFGDYNQLDDIEDTNIPWDWDHIYPASWVKSGSWHMRSIKDWNNTNGNFRALSLRQNRSESDAVSPKGRLDKENMRENSFVLDNDWEYWKMIDGRINKNDEEGKKRHFRAVTTRMINIYEKFWNDLKIGELIVVESESEKETI
jgi:hypothetical protein